MEGGVLATLLQQSGCPACAERGQPLCTVRCPDKEVLTSLPESWPGPPGEETGWASSHPSVSQPLLSVVMCSMSLGSQGGRVSGTLGSWESESTAHRPGSSPHTQTCSTHVGRVLVLGYGATNLTVVRPLVRYFLAHSDGDFFLFLAFSSWIAMI